MITNFLFAVFSMLLVAGLPLIAKGVDNIFNYVERGANKKVHQKIIS